jgi:hypothetical protein
VAKNLTTIREAWTFIPSTAREGGEGERKEGRKKEGRKDI